MGDQERRRRAAARLTILTKSPTHAGLVDHSGGRVGT